MDRKATFANVQCYYTGGGIWVYSAKFNGAWLYGSLDSYMGVYSIPGETIENRHNCEYEKFAVTLKDYPTWGDILQSLKQGLAADPCLHEITENLKRNNPDLSVKVCDDE